MRQFSVHTVLSVKWLSNISICIIMDDEGQENCLGAWAVQNVQEGSLDAKFTQVKHVSCS